MVTVQLEEIIQMKGNKAGIFWEIRMLAFKNTQQVGLDFLSDQIEQSMT